jgi:RHS repeat-associated protein
MYFVYNELGDLLRWQDGRGITNGYGYDLGGRLVSEDYGYTGTNDVVYGYDSAFEAPWYSDTITCHRSDPLSPCPKPQQNLRGRLSYVDDRSGTRIWSYDIKGQGEWVDTQLSSYEKDEILGQWEKRDDLSQIWHVETAYDEMGRTIWEDFPEEGSRVYYAYSERGLIDSVFLDRPTWLETRPVISKVFYDETGKQTKIEYGDGARTTLEYTYDLRQRLIRLLAHQENYVPESSVPEDRTLMDYGYRFDAAGNISAIIDHRDSYLVRNWSPVPVNYYYDYDSLNRLTRAKPVYHEPQPDRVGDQRWTFDKLGSMKTWTDPAHKFYGWSLNHIHNGLQLVEEEGLTEFDGRAPAPHALYKAYDVDPETGKGSFLVAHYDSGGYMTSLEVYRGCGECSDADYSCELPCETAELTQFFWDEVGRLQEAKKLPGTCSETECTFAENPTAHYQHTYDSSNMRTVKRDVLEEGYDLYLSRSFEIRWATLSAGDEFGGGESTKYVSLFGNRIARIAEESTWLQNGDSYFFFNLSNHLGSTSTIVDNESGEIIESRADLPYGATDTSTLNSDPKYIDFAAIYTFTGKENDANLDLFYFGERFFNPLLGKWICPDPLDVNSGGGISSYGYVTNNPIRMVDPTGLQEQSLPEEAPLSAEQEVQQIFETSTADVISTSESATTIEDMPLEGISPSVMASDSASDVEQEICAEEELPTNKKPINENTIISMEENIPTMKSEPASSTKKKTIQSKPLKTSFSKYLKDVWTGKHGWGYIDFNVTVPLGGTAFAATGGIQVDLATSEIFTYAGGGLASSAGAALTWGPTPFKPSPGLGAGLQVGTPVSSGGQLGVGPIESFKSLLTPDALLDIAYIEEGAVTPGTSITIFYVSEPYKLND